LKPAYVAKKTFAVLLLFLFLLFNLAFFLAKYSKYSNAGGKEDLQYLQSTVISIGGKLSSKPWLASCS